MRQISRSDKSVVGKWWWTVDLLSLIALFVVIFLGIFMNMAASPAVADRIGADSFYFIKHQLILLVPTLCVLLGFSFLTLEQMKFSAYMLFIFSVLGLILTLFMGTEIKGAKRWVSIAGFSLQPSEFVKPAFAVVSALCMTYTKGHRLFGHFMAFMLYFFVIVLLLLQPDIGMATIVTSIWFVQIFIAGLPFFYVFCGIGTGALALLSAYFFFPHATKRINQFLDSENLSYQVSKSLEAFKNGGFFGRGPGEGRIKEFLPDAHADFIFAVAGEEFGFLICLLIVLLFVFILARSFSKLILEKNMFVILAGSGLLAQFGLQAFVNMASTVHLIPTKGMTLPFISFGGSSMLALGMGVGMIFALTRKRTFNEGKVVLPNTTILVNKTQEDFL